MNLKIYIFNVEAGQCILIQDDKMHIVLVDCAYNESAMQRIENLLKTYSKAHVVDCLIITNVDEDHISGTNWLLANDVKIFAVFLPNNLNPNQIKSFKNKETPALKALLTLYQDSTPNPPTSLSYEIYRFSLKEDQLPPKLKSTNNFSQVIFIKFNEAIVCIPGDIEKEAWDLLMRYNQEMVSLLKQTKIFIASHHGRRNGYNPNVLKLCDNLECVIISDKSIQHETQEGMVPIYEKYVHGKGIFFKGKGRKVLTTRNDGDICVNIDVTNFTTGKCALYVPERS